MTRSSGARYRWHRSRSYSAGARLCFVVSLCTGSFVCYLPPLAGSVAAIWTDSMMANVKEAKVNVPVVRGSCLCGGVKYEITGPLMRSGHCHCSNCRKAHGAAFRSRARVRVEDFKWVQGEALVKYFESSPGFNRGFCSVCGSPIVNRPDRTPELGIALGGLDDHPGARPERHFFIYRSMRSFLLVPKSPEHKADSSE